MTMADAMVTMTQTRGNVLVVDDEPGIRDMLRHELSLEGFSVETADSGLSAMDAVRRHDFDLVVTDLKMPGMDGEETLTALHDFDPTIEVIVATGHATVQTAVACMKRGAYDYIEKPFDVTYLASLLERAMQKRHLEGVVTLYEASRQLLETLHHDELTPRVVDIARRVLDADAIEVVVEGDERQPLARPRLRALAAYASKQGSAVRFPNARDEIPVALSSGGFGSALVLPLVAGAHPLGHLVALRMEGRPEFTETTLQRGVVLSAQVALSMTNARLYADVSEKMEQLAETKAQLVQGEKLAAIARFASCVAHEINNPLMYVQANLGALREIEDGVGEVTELIDEVLDGVLRISELVASFDEIASPPRPMHPQNVDLFELLAACVATSASQERGLAPPTVSCGASCGDAAPRAWIVPSDVGTAISNVLAFALDRRKHAGRTGLDEVQVRCGSGPRRSCVEVFDPSLCLSEQERMRVLEPLVQTGPCGRTQRLDLGMYVAHQLVARNGGRFDVRGEGAGTTFRISLPARSE